MKKKYLILPLVAVAIAGLGLWAKTSSTDLFTVTGRGASWGQDIFGVNTALGLYLANASGTNVFTVSTAGNIAGSGTLTMTGASTSNGNLTITDDDLVFGDGAVATLSTAATSGNSYGTKMYAYLSGDTDALEGSVLIATTPIVGYGISVAVCLAATDQTSIIGVAETATSTGSIVPIYTSGYVLALTTGTVAVGDTLISTVGARGYLTGDATPTTGADVGIALSARTAGTSGRTRILLYK